jgi:hypothetical protein
MSQVVLNNKAGTNFYAPATPGPGEQMLFLQGSGSAVSSLTLEKAWDPAAGFLGYFLFLSAIPPDGNLKAAEAAIRAALPSQLPSSSSFAWVQFQTNWSVDSINPLLLETSTGDVRLTTADFTTPASDPFPSIPIAAGTPVGVSLDGGFIQGFVVLYPPLQPFDGQPTSQPPLGMGINLPMTGAGVGCLRFQGLMNSTSRNRVNSIQKDQFDASLDPLDLFDASRTFLHFTGAAYILTKKNDGSFTIQPAGVG